MASTLVTSISDSTNRYIEDGNSNNCNDKIDDSDDNWYDSSSSSNSNNTTTIMLMIKITINNNKNKNKGQSNDVYDDNGDD